MKKKAPLFIWKLKSTLGLLWLVALLMTASAWAEEARLTDIVVTSAGDDVLVYFRVADCFTEDMKRAIENGITTTFTFFITLNEIKRLQWDEELADLKISHSVIYDNLKKVYQVKIPERSDEMISVADFLEAKNLMSKIVGFKLTDSSKLQEGKRYQVRMMAELDKIRLPLYLDYVFFFLSLWDFETDWYTVDFKY
jgi:hypothetical protein